MHDKTIPSSSNTGQPGFPPGPPEAHPRAALETRPSDRNRDRHRSLLRQAAACRHDGARHAYLMGEAKTQRLFFHTLRDMGE